MGFFSTIKEKFGGSFGGGDDGMDPDEEIYGTYGEDDEFIGGRRLRSGVYRRRGR